MLENQRNKRRVFVLVTAINVLFLAIVFLTVREANAQIAQPVFTTGTSYADSITAGYFDGTFFRATTTANIGGCDPNNSPQRRFQYAQWYGNSWVLTGGGGFSACEPGGNYLLENQQSAIIINSTNEGYFCLFWGTGGTTLTETNHVKRVCVYQPPGQPGELTVYEQTQPPQPPTYNTPQYNTAYNTKFESVNSLAGELLITHYVDPAEYNPALSEFNPTVIRVQTSLRPTTAIVGNSFDMTGITGTHTTGADLSLLPDGIHDVFINFANVGCVLGLSACPFPSAYVTLAIEMASGTVTIVETPNFYDSTTFLDETADQACGITNIQGCIVNAMRFLFVPAQTSISQFGNTWQDIKTKPPFGYITSIIDETQTLTSTSTPAWEMPDLPFVSAIFDPIKTALALILWGIFGVYFYQRLTRIEI